MHLMISYRFLISQLLVLLLSAGLFAQTYTTEKRLGPVPSGSGKAFSGRYSITSDPPKPGYTVSDSSFHLEGDRSCGSWSECTKVAQDPMSVTWEFRLQGHGEGGPAGGTTPAV